MAAKKIAIIDLGSNSVRMIIMQINSDGSYRLVEQAKEMVRLSEGMGDNLVLQPYAIKRTIYTLNLFKKLIEVNNIDEVHAVATAAVRNAKNKEYFLKKVSDETGINLKIIPGLKEAYYDYLGVINTITINNCLIIDIGGASTELVLVENRQIKYSVSLQIGAVNSTDKFLEKDFISSKKIDFLKNELQKLFNDISWLKEANKLPVVGLGGTVRSLSRIDRRRVNYPLWLIHNYNLSYESVEDINNLMIDSDLESRLCISGLKKERADIAPAGFLIVKELMQNINSKQLIVSGNGLREGVFYKSYLNSEEKVDDVLNHSIDNILKSYCINKKHSYHVQKLALQIFDQTKLIHHFSGNARKLLYAASLLHDIGIYVDYYNHHKHGFYLVLNSHLNGLSHKELLMCAFIVGMHRFQELKIDWKNYKEIINKCDYKLIKKLSLFLRIAESLDKSQSGTVQDINCFNTHNSVHIKLNADESAELELSYARKNKKAFEKLFGKYFYVSNNSSYAIL